MTRLLRKLKRACRSTSERLTRGYRAQMAAAKRADAYNPVYADPQGIQFEETLLIDHHDETNSLGTILEWMTERLAKSGSWSEAAGEYIAHKLLAKLVLQCGANVWDLRLQQFNLHSAEVEFELNMNRGVIRAASLYDFHQESISRPGRSKSCVATGSRSTWRSPSAEILWL